MRLAQPKQGIDNSNCRSFMSWHLLGARTKIPTVLLLLYWGCI
jgi:hypothetical protein